MSDIRLDGYFLGFKKIYLTDWDSMLIDWPGFYLIPLLI